MEQLAGLPKFAPYVDFPIEHASDKMLRLMNRRTSAARMKESINAFRSVRPDAAVRTTVLVGFPGETQDDFAELLQFMEDIRFERAGVFAYSPQEGTTGAELPNRVAEGTALDRLDRLMNLQRKICNEKHRALVGSTMEVIIDRCARGVSWGRSGWDAPDIDSRVRIGEECRPGEIIKASVRKTSAYQLDAELVHKGSDNARVELCGNLSLPVLSQP
jgi:ribosomal protein S12 methylthiotransferase